MSRNDDRLLDHAVPELGQTLLDLPGASETLTPAWREAAAITVDHDGPHISFETSDADTTITALGRNEAMFWIHSDDRRRITALATVASVALTPAAVKLLAEMVDALSSLVS